MCCGLILWARMFLGRLEVSPSTSSIPEISSVCRSPCPWSESRGVLWILRSSQISSQEIQVLGCWCCWALHKVLMLFSSLNSCSAILLCFQCFQINHISLSLSIGQWMCFVQKKMSWGMAWSSSSPLLPDGSMYVRVLVPSPTLHHPTARLGCSSSESATHCKAKQNFVN